MTSIVFSIVFICFSLGFNLVTAVVQTPCTDSDCHPYFITQGSCKDITAPPDKDCRWYAGLNPYVDVAILKGGKIIAFQLQWFSGAWSEWFVPGVNDIGPKFITAPASCFEPADVAAAGTKHLMRWWSYFFDHNHRFIVCYNA